MVDDGLRLTFHGAARTVTGSMHLVEYGGKKVLLDCGLVQGRRKEAFEKNRHPGVDPSSVDAILLSHAHIDHSGNLPTFHRMGFRGKIFATPATRDLCDVMLRDSAKIQERQVRLVNRLRRRQRKNPFEPLYAETDVAAVMGLFEPAEYGRTVELADGFRATFHDAGHILGSAVTVLETSGNSAPPKKLLFTGDLGRKERVILRDPTPVPEPDYIISESTYGDRAHPVAEETQACLQNLIDKIRQKRSRLIIAAFSVGRTQALIYHLNTLFEEGRIGRVPVYLDSPLASRATSVFRQHTECYDAEAVDFLLNGDRPFSFDTFHYVESAEDSKRLNEQRGPFVVISASGMCEGGRVVHHLVHSVGDPDNILLLTGFQARNTLGRKLIEGANPVNIMGRSYRVRADVQVLNALSAHADGNEIVEYFRECKASPRRVFLVHGEEKQAEALRERLGESLHWNDIEIPGPGDSFVLDR